MSMSDFLYVCLRRLQGRVMGGRPLGKSNIAYRAVHLRLVC